jgi:CheY-like chemotaxis protein/anti-sigma regulatory factor (Ser/Thr protein kinase)
MSTKPATNSPDILVVDDDPMSRDMLVFMFQSADIRVVSAGDGIEAIERIKERGTTPFEAIFTDVQMPRMGGLELLEWINVNAPTTATVIMTANQERELVSASLRGGAVEFLDKPFDLRAILRALRQAREIHRNRTQQLAATHRLLDIADINQRLTRTALNAAVCTSAKINLVTRFYPINEAGGDLVKTTALDYDRILLVLGDVSGHGLKEGFLSAYFQGIIEGMANQAATCRGIAESFNRFLLNQWNDTDPFAVATSLSATFLEVDFGGRRVSVLNCGGPAVILSDRRGNIEQLAPGGAPLGWFPEIEPQKLTATLDVAGLLVLFSDGLEAHAERLQVPPIALAYRILQSPANTLANTLLKGADDDIVVCRLDWNPPNEATPLGEIWMPIFNETCPGDSAPRIDAIQDLWARTLTITLPQLGEDTRHDVLLCIREATLNALDHGCNNDASQTTRVELLVNSTAAFLHARITDDGRGFDPNAPRPPVDPEHISLGIQVMRSLTHALRHSNDGRTLEMTFCLPVMPPL